MYDNPTIEMLLPYFIFIGCLLSSSFYFIYFKLIHVPGRWIKLFMSLTMLVGVLFYALIIWDGGISLLALRIWILGIVLAHVINAVYLVLALKHDRTIHLLINGKGE